MICVSVLHTVQSTGDISDITVWMWWLVDGKVMLEDLLMMN